MKFYLGTDRPVWLKRTAVPLFVSRRVLPRRPAMALGPWALDSGAFSELSLHGAWTITPAEYARQIRAWAGTNLEWAASMDFMCEPMILEKCRETVAGHQAKTIDRFLELAAMGLPVPIVPVLQGWEYWDYEEHRRQYERRGVCLEALPLVGLGSICRRQATALAEGVIAGLAHAGIRLHGFGFKVGGLARVHHLLASSDSMAWCLAAWKRNIRLPGCTHAGRCCHCLRWALQWRDEEIGPALACRPKVVQRFLT